MIKNAILLSVLALALPLAAFADSSVGFTNSGGTLSTSGTGTLSGTSGGLTLTGSTLIAVDGLAGGGLVTGNLGSVSFSTSGLSTGSFQMGGTFSAGGTFDIVGNGTSGIPNEIIFNGTFSGPVTWTLLTLANGTHEYTLSGSLTGTWYNGGSTVYGATVQLTINTGKGYFNGSTNIASGDTNIVIAPEPGTLVLMGTGLLAGAGVLRRKLKLRS
ncbi:MAG: PEP-CTERM sorting domain-containing protein [Candidatus Sulfotelmatobacter sp.]